MLQQIRSIKSDLRNISSRAYQWKVNFNPDSIKQAREVIFSRKLKVTVHPQLVFNNNLVHETATQKHLECFSISSYLFKNI